MTLIVLIQEEIIMSKTQNLVQENIEDYTTSTTQPYKISDSNDYHLEESKIGSYKTPLLRRSNSLGLLPSSPVISSRKLEPPRTPIPTINQKRQNPSDQSIYTDDYFATSSESLQDTNPKENGARPKTTKNLSVSSTCLGLGVEQGACENSLGGPSYPTSSNYDICQDLNEESDTENSEHSSDSMFSQINDDNLSNKDTSPTHISNDDDIEDPVISVHHNVRREKQYKHKVRKSQERKDIPPPEQFDEESRKEYLRTERAERKRRRRASSRNSRRSSSNRKEKDLDLESNSLLHPEYGYSFSYTSISELQDIAGSDEEWEEGSCHLYKGMFLAILSGFLFTANNFFLVHYKLSPIDATLIRGFVHCLILGSFYRSRIWCEKIRFVLLQGILGAMGLTCALYCVTLMPVPDALTILFTSPLPTFIFAVLFMGEKPALLKIVAMTSLLFGVVLVCKPSFIFTGHQVHTEINPQIYLGLTLAILSSVFAGITNVTASFTKEVSNGVIVFWVAVSALILSSGLEFVLPGCKILTLQGSQYTNTQWCVLFGLALSGLAAYQSMVKSLQMISPTLVSTLRSLEIVVAFGVQSAIDLAPPDPISCTGAFLVCFGISITGLATWISRPRRGYQQI